MSYQLRPYQRAAVDAVLAHFRRSKAAACVVLPTGAGKSLVIAELCKVARGKVLVLAHVQELCEQNHAKYCAQGHSSSAGLFAAGLGEKRVDAKVTFGSVQSVAPHVDQFTDPISLLIIDECHRRSGDAASQYDHIVSALSAINPELLVLGLTATPYRLDQGYCYRRHVNGSMRSEESRPFEVCVFELTLRDMIQSGYLVRPQLIDAPIAQYDFSPLLDPSHSDNEAEVNRLLVGHERVTESIVEQIVDITRSQQRRGVMIFAASVAHAHEVHGYLPAGEAGLVLGNTGAAERNQTVQRFVRQQLRYLVNVAVLTTGFDAPHVDLIAILRATESVSLYQQIVGRGLRLHPGKSDCLVIDYAGNGYDVYTPEVGSARPHDGSEVVDVTCPVCGFQNQFWGQKDETGAVVTHYGRRCTAFLEATGARCDYRFVFKQCPACLAENDIAARTCQSCNKVLVDPDEMLKDALRLKDARVLRVSGMQLRTTGNRLTIVYHDEDGAELTEHFDFDHGPQRAIFNRIFARRLAQGRRPLELETSAQALLLERHLPRPDFVIGRAQKIKGRPSWYRVEQRVFDYQGRFRRADPT